MKISLLKQAEQFYVDFEKHLKFIDSLISQLKVTDEHELLLYTLQLSNEKMKSRHRELGKQLQILRSRNFRYPIMEE